MRTIIMIRIIIIIIIITMMILIQFKEMLVGNNRFSCKSI